MIFYRKGVDDSWFQAIFLQPERPAQLPEATGAFCAGFCTKGEWPEVKLQPLAIRRLIN